MLCFLLSPGHTDHSEENLSAPLLSISLGQPAIFLIGDSSLATVPTALLLRSGDVLMMERESRLAYHAVPRILAGPVATEQHQDFTQETFQCVTSALVRIWLIKNHILLSILFTWDGIINIEFGEGLGNFQCFLRFQTNNISRSQIYQKEVQHCL